MSSEPKHTPHQWAYARRLFAFISSLLEHEFQFAKKGYLGIDVCSHTTDDYERAIFKDVKFYKR